MTTTKRTRGKTGEQQAQDEMPAIGRTPTSEQLAGVAEAARDAALAAGAAADKVASALEHHNGNGNGGGHEKRIPAKAASTVPAYEEFMEALGSVIKKAGNRIRVIDNAGWVKIEGLESGERVYVNKGKREVTRVTCTLPPSAVAGATEPDVPNGLIQSHLPPTQEAVSSAILQIAGLGGQRR